MFLLYRVLAYSAGRLIAAAAYQFLRYRGRVRNENLAVFLPCRIAEKQAKPDDLLLVVRLPCSESAQRYCAAAQIRSVPSVPVRCCCDTTFLRDRSAEQ